MVPEESVLVLFPAMIYHPGFSPILILVLMLGLVGAAAIYYEDLTPGLKVSGSNIEPQHASEHGTSVS